MAASRGLDLAPPPHPGPRCSSSGALCVGGGEKQRVAAEKTKKGRTMAPACVSSAVARVVPPDGPLLGFVLYPELGYPYTTEYLGLKTT